MTYLAKPIEICHQEVTFFNPLGGITLAGTLTIPKTTQRPPVVLLIAGVGPFDRDCEQMNGQKLFLTIANYFAEHGIAVLRYDKRGIGKSEGVFETATTPDFTRDAQAAVDFLKTCQDVNSNKIGLIGHSEGGLISFILASQSPDIAFMVSMASAVLSNVDDLLLQAELLFKACGASEDFISFDRLIRKQIFETIITLPEEQAKKKLEPLVKTYVESMTSSQKAAAQELQPFALTTENYEYWIATFNTTWRAIIFSNPPEQISHVKIPVLAVNGELDFIIPAQIALPIIKTGLEKAGNTDFQIHALPHQNHVFQECKTGSLSEYAMLSGTIAPSTLKLIADWLISHA